MYQKWPNKIFPVAKFVFSHYGHFGLGGWSRGGGVTLPPPPPMVYSHSNTSPGGGGGASKMNEYVSWYFRVYVLVHLLGRGYNRVANPNRRGKLFLLDESGTVVPLLTSATSAPCRPCICGYVCVGGWVGGCGFVWGVDVWMCRWLGVRVWVQMDGQLMPVAPHFIPPDHSLGLGGSVFEAGSGSAAC